MAEDQNDNPKKPGPEAERVKIDMDWEKAAKKMAGKKKPPEGWPKPSGEKSQRE